MRKMMGDSIFPEVVRGPRIASVARREAKLRPSNGRKDLILVLEAETEREENLALGVHTTVHALLYAVNRPKRDLGLSSELRLGHQSVLTQLSNSILVNRNGLYAVHTFELPQSPNPEMLLGIGVNLDAISTKLWISLEKMSPWRFSTSPRRTSASPAATDRCGVFAHTRAVPVNPRLGSSPRSKLVAAGPASDGSPLPSAAPAEASC